MTSTPRKKIKLDEGEPEFTTYLLSPEVEHDVDFYVGPEKEKIGAVKKMLMAHSEVLRKGLQDSKLAEKGDINVEDISPEAFKNLLRYVYGYNITCILSFDESNELLYAAEKYQMQALKDRVALRLIDLLNSENILSLLNNPACDTVWELDAEIIEIIQYETEVIFKSPEIVNLTHLGFAKILEQDTLMVTELEIWRVALKWAKHQAQSEDVSELRRYLSKLKHIRILAIGLDDFCKEVVPTSVLSDREVVEICAYQGRRKTPPIIGGFSVKTNSRRPVLKQEEVVDIKQNSHGLYRTYSELSITITPKEDIILTLLTFKANRVTFSTKYVCNGVIEVTHVTCSTESSLNPKMRHHFKSNVECGNLFKVKLPANCRKLLSNNSYTIKFTFQEPHILTVNNSQNCHSFNDFTLQSNTCVSNPWLQYCYGFPKSLQYFCCPSK